MYDMRIVSLHNILFNRIKVEKKISRDPFDETLKKYLRSKRKLRAAHKFQYPHKLLQLLS